MNLITPKIFGEIAAQTAKVIDDAYTSQVSRFTDAHGFIEHVNRSLDEVIDRFVSLGSLSHDDACGVVAFSCETWVRMNAGRYESVADHFRETLRPPGNRCRVCGCTNDNCAKCVEKTGSPCHWVEPDLCSACVDDIDVAIDVDLQPDAQRDLLLDTDVPPTLFPDLGGGEWPD